MSRELNHIVCLGSDLNQCSDYIAIFISLISDFEISKIGNSHSVGKHYLLLLRSATAIDVKILESNLHKSK